MSYYRYYSYSPYWNKVQSYLTRCAKCGKNTSKKFAREHEGKCKSCAAGIESAAERVLRLKRAEAERLAMAYDADCCDGEQMAA